MQAPASHRIMCIVCRRKGQGLLYLVVVGVLMEGTPHSRCVVYRRSSTLQRA